MIYQNERPTTFDEVKGQEYIVENIRNQSKNNTWFQQYILGGQFGSGKTTMARIILLAANCENKDENGNPCGKCASCKAIKSGLADFREIDGASNTGIDNIRELQEYISFRPAILKRKVVIIDEVHKLSNSAFNSLLKVLEEPPKYVIFILCTTDVDAIPLTVQSRCAVYRFGPIEDRIIKQHILYVAQKNSIPITDDAAYIIARNSHGAMRNALKLLEQLSASGETITESLCKDTLGLSDEESVFNFIRAFMTCDIPELVEQVEAVSAKGKDYLMLSKDFVTAISDLIIAKCGNGQRIDGSVLYMEHAKKLADEYELQDFCALSEHLVNLVSAMKTDGTRYNFLAQCFAIMEHLRNIDRTLAKRIDKLEQNLALYEKNGAKVVQKQSTDEVMNAGAENDFTSKAVSEELIPEALEKTDAIPEESEQENQVQEVDAAEKGDREEQGEKIGMPETNEMESMDVFADFFDFGSAYDDFFAEDEEIVQNEEDEDVLENNEQEAAAVSERAEKALLELQKFIENEPEVALHLQIGCEQVVHERGVLIKTPELAVANMLSLFIARYSIADVEVIYDINAKIQ